MRLKRATFLSLFDFNLSSNSFSLLDFDSFWLSQFLPSLFLGELFGHWQRIFFNWWLKCVFLRELSFCLTYYLLGLCDSRLRFIPLLFKICVYSWLHVISRYFPYRSSVMSKTSLFVGFLIFVVSTFLFLKLFWLALVLLRIIRETMLLLGTDKFLRFAIHFIQEFFSWMLRNMPLHKMHRWR